MMIFPFSVQFNSWFYIIPFGSSSHVLHLKAAMRTCIVGSRANTEKKSLLSFKRRHHRPSPCRLRLERSTVHKQRQINRNLHKCNVTQPWFNPNVIPFFCIAFFIADCTRCKGKKIVRICQRFISLSSFICLCVCVVLVNRISFFLLLFMLTMWSNNVVAWNLCWLCKFEIRMIREVT